MQKNIKNKMFSTDKIDITIFDDEVKRKAEDNEVDPLPPAVKEAKQQKVADKENENFWKRMKSINNKGA